MFPLCLIQSILGATLLLLYAFTTLGLALVVITGNRNPVKTLAWIVVLLLIPGIGLLLYFLFGQDNRRQRIISRRIYRRITKAAQDYAPPQQETHSVPEAYRPLANLLRQNAHSTLYYGTRIQPYACGGDKFEALLNDIRQATHHIHLQYYIISDDHIGQRFLEALIDKAHQGIHIRIIYDGVGSWHTSAGYFRTLAQHGIEIHPFLPVVFPIFSGKVNYRNHRKIAVIDGRIAYTGGMNIADRYEKGLHWGLWQDLHIRLDGKGVHAMQAAFLLDWYVLTRQIHTDRAYYPLLPTPSDTLLQVALSGPVGQWRTLLQAAIFLITNAKRYVYIQTPYFLPTEGLNQALQIAALGGIDVRLMLPRRADAHLINRASHSYIDEMLTAGVKVYLYQPGFLHSKLLVTDDNVTSVGSANMDFRSFEHNFEVNTYIYHTPLAQQMSQRFLSDIAHCHTLTLVQWRRRPRSQRLLESFMRLFSPLL